MNGLNRMYSKYGLLFVTMLLCASCDWFKKPAAQPAKLILIDVNDDRIYADAHIHGATHMAYEKIDTLDKEVGTWDKNSPVVVYCTNYLCLASKDVAKKLKSLGFNDVRVYSGGIAEWHQLAQKDPKYITEGPQKESYLKKEIAAVKPEDASIVVITAPDLLALLEKFDYDVLPAGKAL